MNIGSVSILGNKFIKYKDDYYKLYIRNIFIIGYMDYLDPLKKDRTPLPILPNTLKKDQYTHSLIENVLREITSENLVQETSTYNNDSSGIKLTFKSQVQHRDIQINLIKEILSEKDIGEITELLL